MEKQTAVEWLVKEFSEILGPLKTKPMQDLLIVDAIKKAKVMDEEQKKEIYENGYLDAQLDELMNIKSE